MTLLTVSPLSELRRLTERNSNGEFVCANSSVEIHVYLQAGRLVWATDSKHPFAFGRHLERTTRVDDVSFRRIVERCRRDKLPLGEALVDSGLATFDEVRTSLAFQVRQAIELLGSLDAMRCIFLERSYAEYNPQLTFSISEFVIEDSNAPPPAREQARHASDGESESLARQLRDAIASVSWVEILAGDAVQDASPLGTGQQRTPQGVINASLQDGADFVAIRSSGGNLVGLSLPGENRSLFCHLGAGSSLGAVLSTLWALSRPDQMTLPGSRAIPTSPRFFAGSTTSPGSVEVADLLQRAPEIRAVVVLDEDPERPVRLGIARPRLDVERLLGLARRRQPCLDIESVSLWDERDESVRSLGYYLETMVSGEGDAWCFGAHTGRSKTETLWLFIDRNSSQGMGWAYLSALQRMVPHLDPLEDRTLEETA